MGGLLKRYENTWELRYIMRLEGVDKYSPRHCGGRDRFLFQYGTKQVFWRYGVDEGVAVGGVLQISSLRAASLWLEIWEGIVALTLTSMQCLKDL